MRALATSDSSEEMTKNKRKETQLMHPEKTLEAGLVQKAHTAGTLMNFPWLSS